MDAGFVSTPGVWGWAGLISFCLIVSFGTWGMPQLVIRFYSIKDVKMLRVGTVVVTVGGSVALLPYLNGAIARILHPAVASPDLAIPTLTKSVLPPIGGAVFLAGVIAAGMSTFAGVLIISSTSLIRDTMEHTFGKVLTQAQQVKYARVANIVLGGIAILIGLRPPNLILVLTAFSWAVIASTNLWPLLFGIYWRRTNSTATLASMVAGAATAITWTRLGNPLGLHGFIAGVSVALAIIVLGSLAAGSRAGPVSE
jgi:Na+/pantothenate symporter